VIITYELVASRRVGIADVMRVGWPHTLFSGNNMMGCVGEWINLPISDDDALRYIIIIVTMQRPAKSEVRKYA